ncbi:hypothetical protein EVAR_31333_1 [Eumeta japonica]|uniref:Uncharacterized protein n=1 Tax=Eumeta variegata TaxID=151549 RepID=A0A4C1XYV4_EUMVA|nr:hypothetical protein EVAR_31333_1 [Eumeta japonica]
MLGYPNLNSVHQRAEYRGAFAPKISCLCVENRPGCDLDAARSRARRPQRHPEAIPQQLLIKNMYTPVWL